MSLSDNPEETRVCEGCGTEDRDWWRPHPTISGEWLCGWCYSGVEDAPEPVRYRARFTGRLKGAIGISYRFAVDVEAADEEAARLKLYNTHEHIHGLRLERLSDA